jgi:hypothetical protein
MVKLGTALENIAWVGLVVLMILFGAVLALVIDE